MAVIAPFGRTPGTVTVAVEPFTVVRVFAITFPSALRITLTVPALAGTLVTVTVWLLRPAFSPKLSVTRGLSGLTWTRRPKFCV